MTLSSDHSNPRGRFTAATDDSGIYALAAAGERQARRRLLADPDVAPLTRLVEEIRAEEGLAGEVPYFDPHDAGARARVLFLLEAPGKVRSEK